jgi:DNA-binding transcriptional regulator LsrR (DeoR family)
MQEISTLGKEKHRDPAVVSRAISEAFRKGLVEIRTVAKSEYPEYPREYSSEEDLKSKFNLPGAVVIRVPPPHLEDVKTWNDRLHSALGFSLARMIASGGFVFGAGARIGIGSGRGVFFAVDWLAKLAKLRAANVQAFSLTGATYPQTHAKDGLRLDADTNVNLFAGNCFAAPAKPNFVHSPIVAPEGQREAVYKRAFWLKEEKSNPFSLTHAIVGVGAFTFGHRLYDEGRIRLSKNRVLEEEAARELHGDSRARAFQPEQPEGPPANETTEPIFDDIGDKLAKLAYWCDQCTSPFTSPVADICHNLLPVQPPAEKKAKRLGDLVQGCIAEIARDWPFITVSEARLRETENIMLVAGGPKKTGPIRLLLEKNYPITLLCTDNVTARELLK